MSSKLILKNLSNNKILLSILFIVTLTLGGWGISALIDSFIPFWLLLGFSVVYSIEKWLSYYTRKYKTIGKTYRLILNLSTLSLLGLIIWSGILLFSQQFLQSPLVGSLVFISEIGIFIWLCRIVRRNSWRQPSMRITVLAVICTLIILAFAGVQPMSGYKDEAIVKITAYRSEQKERAEARLEQDNNEQDVIDVIDNSESTNINDYADKFNQYRQSKGLTSLEFTDDLNRVAELRLKELYTDFSHYSAGNYNEHLAENIAMSTGFLSNSDALEMWQNSPGHNANMLDSYYRYTGYAIGNGYAVQVFTEFTTINGKPQLPPGWYWAD